MYSRMCDGLVTKEFKWDLEECRQVPVQRSRDGQLFKAPGAASLGHSLLTPNGDRKH